MTAPALAFDEVSKWFGEVIGVNRVTLEVGPGVTGLLGPNGAGKSTLLKLATGQIRPGGGGVRVFGLDPFVSRAVFRRVGYCPDGDAMYDGVSAAEFVILMARLAGYGRAEARRRAETRLGEAGLAEVAGRPVRSFSKGMRQRLKLAAALVHDPELLVLDEPLNGLDPAGRMDMLDRFRALGAEGRAVLVSSHVLHEVEAVAPRVVLMARGRLLAEGRVDEIRALLDSRPLTLRIETADPRQIASLLAGVAGVVGVEIDEPAATLTVRTESPDDVCATIQTESAAGRIAVRSVIALDENLDAVFDYLAG